MRIQIQEPQWIGTPFIHPSAEVSRDAVIGEGTRIWHHAQVRERARIGRHCILGKCVYIDRDVVMGDNVKIENGCCVYLGATLEDGVFLGPGVVLTNDKLPRAINPDGSPKADGDWEVGKIVVKRGASLGAGVTVLPGVIIGTFAMVGAGAVVSRVVPDHGLVLGNPARVVGYVCYCGAPLSPSRYEQDALAPSCSRCGMSLGSLRGQLTA